MPPEVNAELIKHVLYCDEKFCVEFRKALEALDLIDAHGCDDDSRVAAAVLPFPIGHSCCPLSPHD